MATRSKAIGIIYLRDKGLNKCGADGKEKLTQEYLASQVSRTWQLVKMGKEVKGERKVHNDA